MKAKRFGLAFLFFDEHSFLNFFYMNDKIRTNVRNGEG